MHSSTIYKPMRHLIVLLFFIVAGSSAFSAHLHRQKTEAISGQIVAYSSGLVCTNGNGYWSMIIRVQPHKNTPSRLIKVDFSYPCDKSPEWVSALSQIQTFHLFRQRDCDAVLEEELPADAERRFKSSNVVNKNDTIRNFFVLPIWRYPTGIEPFTLPFGQILPCYHSLDLPYLPVL
jgi:hypothetical protein